MEGDRGIGSDDSEIAISFPEPPAKHFQGQSSGHDEEKKEGGNVSDDPIRVLRLEIETLRHARSDLQRKLASSTADFQRALSLKSSEAENARAEADTTKKALEDQKNDLENRVRDIERRMADLVMAKELETANFLKEEGELRLVAEKLNLETEKARVALKEKKDAVALILKELNKWPIEMEAKIKIADEKEWLTSLEEKQRILREKYVKEGALHKESGRLKREMREQELENERKHGAARKEEEKLVLEKKKKYEKWKDEKLKRLRERKSNYEEWIQGIFLGDMEVQEEVIASFMEELGIQPENWRNAFDIEKKRLVAALKENLLESSMEERMIGVEMANMQHDEIKRKVHDLPSDHDQLMDITLLRHTDGILQRFRRLKARKSEVELKFSWVPVIVATIVAIAVLQFLQATLGRIAKD